MTSALPAEESTRPIRVLYVIPRRNTFTDIDREVLSRRFEVTEYYQPGQRPRLGELIAKMRRCDVVFAWFASWHSLAALSLARLLRKPSVLVVGGFDTASIPEIGYGWQRGGIRQTVSRRTMRMATRLVTNSRNSLHEIETNVGLDPRRVAVVYHGLEDRFGELASTPRERLALSVGVVRRRNLERKGLRPFVRAGAHLPDVQFVLAGSWKDDAIDLLRHEASGNVSFTGYLDDADLDALFRRAGVYVQASRHEGFGLSLAEAMLAGCVPVVTQAGALPEVVGDVGVTVASPDPELVADGVRRALAMGPQEGARARARVLEQFPLEARAAKLWAEVEAAARGHRSG
jgi:glycosyltransferase involved in cell wall biosynthesis